MRGRTWCQRSLGKFSWPSPFPIASLPLNGARLHRLDLFLHFIQFIVVQFNPDTVVGEAECSWITETSLEGRQFPLKICI